MKFLVGSCEQRPMLRDGTVLRSSAVIGTIECVVQGRLHPNVQTLNRTHMGIHWCISVFGLHQ